MANRVSIGWVAFLVLAGGCDPEPARDVFTPTPTQVSSNDSEALYEWKSSVVDQRYAGLQTQLVIDPNGRPAVVYFAPAYDELTLPEIPDDWEPPPTGEAEPEEGGGARQPEVPDGWTPPEDLEPVKFYDLRYAWWDGSDWHPETVAQVSHARGVSLAYSPTGYPLISFLNTDDGSGPEWCAAATLDVAIRTTEDWKISTVVGPSYTVEDICTPGDDCPDCEVVGLGSSLAVSADGTVGIAYRRARYASETMLDPDTSLELVEIVLDGTDVVAGVPEVVHDHEGAGFFSAIRYASASNGQAVPHIAYMNFGEFTDEALDAWGLWLARYDLEQSKWVRSEVEPATNWVSGPQLQLLIDGRTTYLLVRAIRAEATSVLVDLVLLASSDGGETWSREYIVSDGRAGSYPSLARGPDGNLAASFYKCGDIFEADCTPDADGLMFATRGISAWNVEPVLHNDSELDGMFTSLEFMNQTPVIAARSARWRGVNGEQKLKVYFGNPLGTE